MPNIHNDGVQLCKYHTEQNWEIGEKNTNFHLHFHGEQGQLGGQSAGLVIQRSRVQFTVWAAGEFSFPGPTFCADSYFGTRFTSVLPQYQIKDPGHSAKSAGGRLHRMH